MIEMGIEKNLLQDIVSGVKTIEGRLRTGKFVTLRTGDTISFREDTWEHDNIIKSIPNAVTATITSTQFFDTFNDMLNAVDYRTAIPSASSQADALAIYRSFYSDGQESEYGVVAIEFSVK